MANNNNLVSVLIFKINILIKYELPIHLNTFINSDRL